MEESTNTQIEEFGALPQALVENLVAKSEELGKIVTLSLESVRRMKDTCRNTLQTHGIFGQIDELPSVPHPTTCGVDGAYIVEPLIAYDLTIIAGLAVEGLTPPSNIRKWDEPHFTSFINTEPHIDANKSYARALMAMFELEQAAKTQHDIIFLDGSFVSFIIALNQALSKPELQMHLKEGNERSLSFNLTERTTQAIRDFHEILTSTHSDKSCICVPKYTTKREIGRLLKLESKFDDRALCTMILDPGEFIGPVQMETPIDRGWSGYYLNRDYIGNQDQKVEDIEDMLSNSISIVYYRASPSNPALRIEMPSPIADNKHRLSMVLQAIKLQSAIPGMLEPQPLYYADQMAKSLSLAVSALREMLFRFSSSHYSGNVNDVFFMLHGYRTEGE